MGVARRVAGWSAVCLMACVATASAQPSALSPFSRQKAESLLRSQLSCLGCHQLGAEGGRLAPALDDVLKRRTPEYIAAIITDPQSVVPGTIMPRAMLPDRERDLLIRYFGGASEGTRSPTASTPKSPRVITTGNVAIVDTSAAQRYQRLCAGCHGASGNGDGPNAPYLPVVAARHSDAAAMSQRSDDALFDTVHGGGAIMKRSARMPAFGGSLTSADIRGLVRYMRTLCKCEGPAWSRDGLHDGALGGLR